MVSPLALSLWPDFRAISFDQPPIRRVTRGQIGIVVLKALEQLGRDHARVNAGQNREVPCCAADGAFVDQPDIQALFLGVHPKKPGADKRPLPIAVFTISNRCRRIFQLRRTYFVFQLPKPFLY